MEVRVAAGVNLRQLGVLQGRRGPRERKRQTHGACSNRTPHPNDSNSGSLACRSQFLSEWSFCLPPPSMLLQLRGERWLGVQKRLEQL